MKNYKIGLFGSAGVRTMEINENFMSDDFALNYVERSLRYYYPVFYSAAVWRLDDEGNGTLLAEFSSTVSVTMKRKES